MKNLVENLNQLFADFTKDAASQVENGNKAAGTRARKTSLAIEKALKEFRKVSIEEGKK
ncbi:histone H1 [Dysgonomonas sp. 521]|uniref:histone H1 n=1 Tax=Dysgonomonas sp. 521 TaxID=2302932 RepID=UPI0013D07C51|nr:histone H1 [Dysgonomonas sp. 521]NDV97470.1 histone H1 [Dysgonomonas sp. 521]